MLARNSLLAELALSAAACANRALACAARTRWTCQSKMPATIKRHTTPYPDIRLSRSASCNAYSDRISSDEYEIHFSRLAPIAPSTDMFEISLRSESAAATALAPDMIA